MAIVPIVGSLPKERLRSKKRKYKPNAVCEQQNLKHCSSPKNPQMIPEAGLCFTPQKKKLNQNSLISPCKKKLNLTPNLMQILF